MDPQVAQYGGSSAGTAAGIFGGLIGTVVWLAVMVLLIVGMWKLFSKAGEPGWYSIIPIWSTIVLLKIVGRPVWWFLLLLIPLVNIVVLVIVMNDLSKSFGQGMGFTIGLILLPYVFMLILGFGSSRYVGPGGVAVTASPTYAPPPAYQTPPPPPTA